MKTTKISKKLQAKIDSRNKLFKAATPAEKRVLIAKDVLKMLGTKQILAHKGNWAEIIHGWEYEPEDSLQHCLLENKMSCSCCALGSIMVSLIKFKNNIKKSDYSDGALDFNRIWNDGEEDKLKIKSLFSAKQLQLIEVAFERGRGYFREGNDIGNPEPDELSNEELDKAIDFGRGLDSDVILIKIMRNIVDNKGTFVV